MKNVLISMSPSQKNLLALFAGCLAAFSFAPFQIFPMSIVAIVLLQYTLEGIGAKSAFWRAWLFGIGLFSFGVHSVFISLNQYGGAGVPFALVFTATFISFLAIFPGLSAYFLNRYFPKGQTIRFIFAFPAIWTLLEWFREFILAGFPWVALGYSQILSPLRGYAPIFSVYGVSFALLLSSGLIFKAISDFRQRAYIAMCNVLIALLLLWGIGAVLSSIEWTKPEGTPIRVSLVQGNVPQTLKWTPQMIPQTMSNYADLSKPHWGSALVIWPESAIPDFMENHMDFLKKMDKIAKKNHSTLILGIPARLGQAEQYYNTAVAFGNGKGYYLKRRLAPFGEYIPLEKQLSGFMNILDIPFVGFIPGDQPIKPLVAGSLKILVFICYEVAFAGDVRFNNSDVNLLVTLTDDSWFGYSNAQAQHLEMAAMRALETGRPMLMASNDGPTAIVNAKGQIIAIAPSHIKYVLSGYVQPTKGKTPWMILGTNSLIFLILSMLLYAIYLRNKLKP